MRKLKKLWKYSISKLIIELVIPFVGLQARDSSKVNTALTVNLFCV